jgi:signal transduction histidine kinase
MPRFRLRTKFLLSLLLVSVGLTCATLLIVRRSIQLHVRGEILYELRNSVATFQHFQRQREVSLSRSAELLASLPTLKALMTTQDTATIQDGSGDLLRLGGSDLLVLADRSDRIVALHATTPGLARIRAQEFLDHSVHEDEAIHWWLLGGHLYEVFLQPIYFGSAANNRPLGQLAVGYEIDGRAAQEVSRIAASQVAFRYGSSIVATTLTPRQESELGHQIENSSPGTNLSDEIQLTEGRFLATSVDLAPQVSPAVRLSVLKSYDQAVVFLGELNRLLLGLGLVAVVAGSLFVYLISRTFTRPLENLVAGVRALGKGDFMYPLAVRGSDEVAEVTSVFDKMRHNLLSAQQQLLDSERLAIIGRMAGSISHDLRHPLTAIVANAEFLSERSFDARQREELYQEIRFAVDQMTDLIESLLEFSSTSSSIHLFQGDLKEVIEHAIHIVRTNPEFQAIPITLSIEGRSEARFDAKKLQRAISNLVLNACEAVPPDAARIEIRLREANEQIEIQVIDNGPGVPDVVRGKLFQPFVSYGKEKGTGLGLATAQKILQDHGGDVVLESSSPGHTIFKLVIPVDGVRTKAAEPVASLSALVRLKPTQ